MNRITICHFGLLLAVGLSGCRAVNSFETEGAHLRVDLVWERPQVGEVAGYHVYRSDSPAGEFVRLTPKPQHYRVYSDFLGRNGLTRYYRVQPVYTDETLGPLSAAVSVTSRAMNDQELLTSVQKATFRYFWHHAVPGSGLILERADWIDGCSASGTSFGMLAILVGIEREFVTRQAGAERIRTMLRFLEETAVRYHGAWPHYINGFTGEAIPFTKHDDGADLVETSFLCQAMLTARQYFDGDTADEREIRERATRLWREVEWDFFHKPDDPHRLMWHWSPTYGFAVNLPIGGGQFQEGILAYVLAIASPTHSIPLESYYKGWIRDPAKYCNGKEYFGHRLAVGKDYGGPLFWTHYPFLGLDPRQFDDGYANYFENSRQIVRIHQAYCAANPGKRKGYSATLWGITACEGPGKEEYLPYEPGHDDGTIAPTAALSSMPYTPEASRAMLKTLYETHGQNLWGPLGFYDSFNLDQNFYARVFLAIDQGPIVIMIENARSGLLWEMFMKNPEIQSVCKAIRARGKAIRAKKKAVSATQR